MQRPNDLKYVDGYQPRRKTLLPEDLTQRDNHAVAWYGSMRDFFTSQYFPNTADEGELNLFLNDFNDVMHLEWSYENFAGLFDRARNPAAFANEDPEFIPHPRAYTPGNEELFKKPQMEFYQHLVLPLLIQHNRHDVIAAIFADQGICNDYIIYTKDVFHDETFLNPLTIDVGFNFITDGLDHQINRPNNNNTLNDAELLHEFIKTLALSRLAYQVAPTQEAKDALELRVQNHMERILAELAEPPANRLPRALTVETVRDIWTRFPTMPPPEPGPKVARVMA